jgi:hypothetical protein
MGDPMPLCYLEIDAWARLTKRTPVPCEVQLLVRLDQAMLAKANQAPALPAEAVMKSLDSLGKRKKGKAT